MCGESEFSPAKRFEMFRHVSNLLGVDRHRRLSRQRRNERSRNHCSCVRRHNRQLVTLFNCAHTAAHARTLAARPKIPNLKRLHAGNVPAFSVAWC